MEKIDGGDFPPKNSQSGEQVTGSVASASSSDFPLKKLARQLDFTAFTSSSTGVVALPEHPQQQQQQNPQNPLPPPPPPPPSVRPSLQPPKQRPIVPIPEVKDGTPKKQKHCNCKNSRCLKLYCECFASGVYCDGCNCLHCSNNAENEAYRQEAVEATLERNPTAFRPKIASSPHAARDNREETGDVSVVAKHNKGCNCKKSGCLKGYCECFQNHILCSEICKCIDCKNFEGSEERRSLFHGDRRNALYMQQAAANAAITGAIGSSGFGSPPVSRKRKTQELYFGTTAKDPSVQKLAPFPQVNQPKATTPSSLPSLPLPLVNPGVFGSSKFTYRSLLAGTVHRQDVKELCSLLVVVSGQAAKALSVKDAAAEKQPEREDQVESGLASSNTGRENMDNQHGIHKSVDDRCSSGNRADKVGKQDSGSDGNSLQNGRPMSPGTLALMCDEPDTMFMAAASPSGAVGYGGNIPLDPPYGQGMTEAYAEQERLVLATFRDCLHRIITCGRIKEEKLASPGTRTETWNQHEVPQHNGNGVIKPAPPTSAEISQPLPSVTVTSNNSLPLKVGQPSENGDIAKPKMENQV